MPDDFEVWGEEWRPVNYMGGHFGDVYQVSSHGRIRSRSNRRDLYDDARWRLLNPARNKKGYRQVNLSWKGVSRYARVNRLVALAFHPDGFREGLYVCHVNGNRADDRAENLKWADAEENAADRERHGRTSRGPDHRRRIKEGREHAKRARLAPARETGAQD